MYACEEGILHMAACEERVREQNMSASVNCRWGPCHGHSNERQGGGEHALMFWYLMQGNELMACERTMSHQFTRCELTYQMLCLVRAYALATAEPYSCFCPSVCRTNVRGGSN
jgi:hypothetical protein